ncbi:MAG: MBL fold metallo-hydrolase [Bacteroidetes bacterium]|nr:MBL fold metallo-hydrolase [Bacteroidota bacterium]
MHIEQIYTNCLAQASYYVESEGEAAVIDPIRDYEIYVKMASERGAKIKYIFETHFHADFVSGHLDMAKATGATIVFGPNAECGFECIVAHDNDIFNLGNTQLQVLHTPGHTPESSCYLLKDENGDARAVFTGDTLFVGDVGRPDLCQAGLHMSMQDMAGMLYESLHNKILKLDDHILVYPGHGPGSACGKSLGPEKASTIGKEKQSNYALQAMDKNKFIEVVTDGIAAPPSYFFEDASLNKNGYSLIDDILKEAKGLDLAAFDNEIKAGALVLDSRIPDLYEIGFIPGAINIGLNGQYAIWAATLFDLDRKIVIVAEAGKERESIVRLTRVGFSNIKGYLSGGMDVWQENHKPLDMVISITPEEFALDKKYSEVNILDVRKPSEWAQGIVENAHLLNLEDLQDKLDTLDPEAEYEIHCAGGYRSMIACSILKAHGFNRIKNVYGGYNQIKTTDISIVIPEAANA